MFKESIVVVIKEKTKKSVNGTSDQVTIELTAPVKVKVIHSKLTSKISSEFL